MKIAFHILIAPTVFIETGSRRTRSGQDFGSMRRHNIVVDCSLAVLLMADANKSVAHNYYSCRAKASIPQADRFNGAAAESQICR